LARPRPAEHAARMTWLQALALAYTRPAEGLSLTASPMLGQALDERWTARLTAVRALMLGFTGRVSEVEPTAQRALAGARRLNDGLAAGYALYAQAFAASLVDGCRAIELTNEALAAAGEDPDTAELRLTLLANQTFAYDQLGMRAEAEATVRAALVLADTVSSSTLAATQLQSAVHWFERGRWDDALAVLAFLDDVPVAGFVPVRLHSVAALIAGHRDNRAALRHHLKELESRGYPAEVIQEHGRYLVRARALAAERDGRPDQALAILAEQLGSRRRLDAVRVGYYGLPDMVRLALAVDDQAAAQAAADASTADDEHTLPRRSAVVNRCRGLLDSDTTLLLDAADYYRDAGEPLALAATLEDAAVVSGERGDIAAGKRAFAESVETYMQLGAAWDIRRAETRVRRYGISRGQRGPRRRPSSGWEALTPTEARVARLVAAGLSNPEIAQELFLSRRTVQTHVSHILAKLDVRSRWEVAELAGRDAATAVGERTMP
jgi:DNA-binding CsgD family transcriptional regulator